MRKYIEKTIDNINYLVDENNNRVNLNKYSLYRARIFLDSLIDCENCEDCLDCFDTKNSKDCVKCFGCDFCVNCSFLVAAFQCKNVIAKESINNDLFDNLDLLKEEDRKRVKDKIEELNIDKEELDEETKRSVINLMNQLKEILK